MQASTPFNNKLFLWESREEKGHEYAASDARHKKSVLLASLLLKGVKKVTILILRTGSPSSKYDNRHCYVRSKYKDMGEKKLFL